MSNYPENLYVKTTTIYFSKKNEEFMVYYKMIDNSIVKKPLKDGKEFKLPGSFLAYNLTEKVEVNINSFIYLELNQFQTFKTGANAGKRKADEMIDQYLVELETPNKQPRLQIDEGQSTKQNENDADFSLELKPISAEIIDQYFENY